MTGRRDRDLPWPLVQIGELLRRGEAVLLMGAAAVSVLAGLILMRGAAAGLEWVAAAAVIGAVLVVFAMADERVAVVLFGLSFLTVGNPDLRLKVGPLWIPLPAFAAGLICARELVRRCTTGSVPLFMPTIQLLGLFVAFGLSGFVAVNPTLYLAELVKWSAHVLVFVSMVMVLQRSQLVYLLLDLLTVTVGLLAAYGLYRVFSGQAYALDIFAGVGTRSAASLYITAVLPLVYGRILDSSGFRLAGRATLLTLLGTALVFTYTRAGWVGSTCGLLVVAGRRWRAYVYIVLALATLILLAPQGVRDRFLSIFIVADYGADSQYESSTVLRQHLLRSGIRMAKDNWLIGVGLGSYWGNYYHYTVPGSQSWANTPHNFFVLLLAETGILGLLSFLWLFASRMWIVWKEYQVASGEARASLRALLGSFVAMAVEASFEDDLNVIIMWTLLGIGTALVTALKRERA